jgi:hypothetical protein
MKTPRGFFISSITYHLLPPVGVLPLKMPLQTLATNGGVVQNIRKWCMFTIQLPVQALFLSVQVLK